jgi:hypothetical protein
MTAIKRDIKPVGEKDEAVPFARGWEATRLTLIGILLGVAIAVGFGVETLGLELGVPGVTTLLVFTLSFVLLALAFKARRTKGALLWIADRVLSP